MLSFASPQFTASSDMCVGSLVFSRWLVIAAAITSQREKTKLPTHISLDAVNCADWLKGLILDGIVAGVGAGAEILVCTALNYADSLSVSSVGKPILLVGDTLTAAQKAYLSSLPSGCSFTIVGGTNAVSADIEAALGSYGTVDRLAGATRFETSVLVAQRYFSAPDAAVLVYALDYPDGLCAGSLGRVLGAPVLLATTESTSAPAAYAGARGIHTGYVVGGPTRIDDSAVVSILGLASADCILVRTTK